MGSVIDTSLSLITGPSIEPIDLDEMKKFRRFGSTSLDTLFDVWGSAARQHFEEQTGRQLLTATWEYALDGVPSGDQIELPRPPLQTVDSVTYDDGDSVEQTFAASNYRVIAPAGSHAAPGRIVLLSGSSWPTTSGLAKSVRIRFTAGYGDAPGAVPELARYALYMLIGHFQKFGEEVQDAKFSALPIGASMVIRNFRDSALPTLIPRTTWLV